MRRAAGARWRKKDVGKKYKKEYQSSLKFRNWRSKYRKERYANDENYRISIYLGNRVRDILSRYNVNKQNKTIELLGCNLDYFVKYIEKQFTDRMSWKNHGPDTWHIDHIKPCASFDLSKEEEQKKCFHYTNLQPLWAKDNLKKGAKLLPNKLSI